MTLSSLERLKLESYLSNKLVQRDDRIRAQALLPKLPTEGTLETWGRLFSCAAEIGIKDSLIILHYALQNGLVHKQCTEGPLIQRDAILDWLNLDNNLPAIWRCYCSSYQGEPAQFPQGEPDKPEQGAAAKHETELQMHKRECQEIGKRLWGENPNSTKTEIMKHPEMLFYVQAYKGKNTISGWLAIIDPRPKSKRRGRPKKIPV